uniref:uncharacterized protein LOC122783710 isoform X1 n=1 Tax=Solea senegalensis TaxID=28829 RepID=UPI001CD83EA1|nr:uncharacterized protein LOC122783710 isoform X1 [Solea senegalensis]
MSLCSEARPGGIVSSESRERHLSPMQKSENASRMDRNNLQVTDQWELQRTSSLHPQQPSRTPLTSGVQRMSSVPCLVCGDGQTRREAFKVVTFQSERGHELRTLQELRRIQTEDISKVHDRAQTLFLLRGDGDNKSPVGREGHSETEDRRVKHEEMEAAGGKVEVKGESQFSHGEMLRWELRVQQRHPHVWTPKHLISAGPDLVPPRVCRNQEVAVGLKAGIPTTTWTVSQAPTWKLCPQAAMKRKHISLCGQDEEMALQTLTGAKVKNKPRQGQHSTSRD